MAIQFIGPLIAGHSQYYRFVLLGGVDPKLPQTYNLASNCQVTVDKVTHKWLHTFRLPPN